MAKHLAMHMKPSVKKPRHIGTHHMKKVSTRKPRKGSRLIAGRVY